MRELITKSSAGSCWNKVGELQKQPRERGASHFSRNGWFCVSQFHAHARREKEPAEKNSQPKCIPHFKKAALARERDKSQHLIQFKKFYFIPFLAPLPTFGCACKYFKLSLQMPTLRSHIHTHARYRTRLFWRTAFFLLCLPTYIDI